MDGQSLRNALHTGDRVIGTHVVSPSPHWPEALRDVKLDFVFLDSEHIAVDRTTLAWMCQAYRVQGLAPLVRIPSPDPYQATMALDGGAVGVVAPYVESPEEVRALVGVTKLRPLKGRRLARMLEGEEAPPELSDYLAGHNDDNLLVINVESEPALEALDDLLGVRGLDAVQVGPHDLSCSLGLPERYDHPKFQAAVTHIIARARARGIGAGVHAFYQGGLEHEKRWIELGANLIVHGADVLAMQRSLAQDVGELRVAAGGGGGVGDEKPRVRAAGDDA